MYWLGPLVLVLLDEPVVRAVVAVAELPQQRVVDHPVADSLRLLRVCFDDKDVRAAALMGQSDVVQRLDDAGVDLASFDMERGMKLSAFVSCGLRMKTQSGHGSLSPPPACQGALKQNFGYMTSGAAVISRYCC